MISGLSSARTYATGRQPHDSRVSNRYPRPRTYPRRPSNLCHEGRYEVVQQVVVWFDCFYPDTQGCCGSLYTVYIQTHLSCGVAPFSYPLPLPLSSCLGCIPPRIGLPFLRFYAVASSLFLLFVSFCLCFHFFLSIATISSAVYFLVLSLLSAFPAYLRTNFRFDLVWFRLSCDHGCIRSGSVHVR